MGPFGLNEDGCVLRRIHWSELSLLKQWEGQGQQGQQSWKKDLLWPGFAAAAFNVIKEPALNVHMTLVTCWQTIFSDHLSHS